MAETKTDEAAKTKAAETSAQKAAAGPSQEEARKAVDAPVTIEDNPKVIAPAGTVPTSMAAPGASPPHPASDRVDQSQDTEEISSARARATGFDDEPAAVRNKGEAIGEPIQCIAKRKFFDDRGALVKAGATYYYQPRAGADGKKAVFPANVLEPVNKSVAAKVRKEYDEVQEERKENRKTSEDRRRAFARLAAETE